MLSRSLLSRSSPFRMAVIRPYPRVRDPPRSTALVCLAFGLGAKASCLHVLIVAPTAVSTRILIAPPSCSPHSLSTLYPTAIFTFPLISPPRRYFHIPSHRSTPPPGSQCDPHLLAQLCSGSEFRLLHADTVQPIGEEWRSMRGDSLHGVFCMQIECGLVFSACGLPAPRAGWMTQAAIVYMCYLAFLARQVLTTVTTTRKIFSTLFSVFRNPANNLNSMQWGGCSLVFAGLVGK